MSSTGSSSWFESFSSAIKPKADLTVWEWADKNRILPDNSAEPGKYRTDRTPYLREIMEELSAQSDAQKIVFMKGSQVGGTEVGNNWIGYTIDHDPATMMVVWPGLPEVQSNTKLRITPLIDDTPCIKEKVYDQKGRSDGSSSRFKKFDGGALLICGSHSAAALKSTPAKKLFLDEIDEYPDDCENQGDPITLVMVRSRTFGSKRKAFLCSTPTYKGISKIAKEFRASDQRYYYVPCPHCKEKQVLEWSGISFEFIENENGDPTVTSCLYYCKHCGEGIEESDKTWMISRESGAEWISHNPTSNIPGFHLNALYSPLGWFSWMEAAQDFVDAEKNLDKKKTFVNTVTALEYEEDGESPQFEALFKRREQYSIGTVPRGVVFLTAAADIQLDRIEVEVIGWGRNKERWSIEHKVIPGMVHEEEVWKGLSLFLESEFKHVDGHKLGITMAGIDSGYEAQRVYDFCKKYSPSKVIPLKGRDDLTSMIGTPVALEIRNSKTGKKKKRGVRLWMIGVNLIKDEVYGGLKLSPPDDIIDGYPAGFTHFPQYDLEYFRQLCAEKRILVKKPNGFTKYSYVKHYERNEILDLHVYNRAISSIVGIDRLNESGWKRLEEQNKLALKLKTKENEKEDKRDRSSKKKKVADFWNN